MATPIPYRSGELIRIVFLFQAPSFWPSWESFFHACCEDGRFDVRLVLLDKKALSDAQTANARQFLDEQALRYEPFDSFDFEAFLPHVVVMQSPGDTLLRTPEAMSIRFVAMGARIVYIPYGIEIGDTADARLTEFYSFVIQNAWRIYLISQQMKERYQEGCPNRGALRVCGHPKFDAYTDPSCFPIPESLERHIGGRRVVLWKLHYPKTIYESGKSVLVTPVLEEYLRFAQTLSDYHDFFFIVMMHPIMLRGDLPPMLKEQTAALLAELEGQDNVYIDKADDYRPSLLRADAVIIDRSALMIEAAVTGAPVLYMSNSDHAEKLTEMIQLLVDAYYQGNAFRDMITFMQMLQEGRDPKKDLRREAFSRCIPYVDGGNGKRIAEDIAQSLKEESGGRRVRIAAFGMGALFQHYWQTTDVFRHSGYELVVLSDNNRELWKTVYHGIPVVEPKVLRTFDIDIYVIVSEQYFMDIYKQLVFEVNIDMNKILRFDKFVFGMLEGKI